MDFTNPNDHHLVCLFSASILLLYRLIGTVGCKRKTCTFVVSVLYTVRCASSAQMLPCGRVIAIDLTDHLSIETTRPPHYSLCFRSVSHHRSLHLLQEPRKCIKQNFQSNWDFVDQKISILRTINATGLLSPNLFGNVLQRRQRCVSVCMFAILFRRSVFCLSALCWDFRETFLLEDDGVR